MGPKVVCENMGGSQKLFVKMGEDLLNRKKYLFFFLFSHNAKKVSFLFSAFSRTAFSRVCGLRLIFTGARTKVILVVITTRKCGII